MTAGKALATLDADADAVCTPSPKGSAIVCIRLLPTAMQTDPTNIAAGRCARRASRGCGDAAARARRHGHRRQLADTNVRHFQVGFPVPGSETIAWSARTSVSGPEVLKIQTMGNDASRATVASGVNSWQVSPDGARWYWLTSVNETDGTGAVQSAPFPAGTSPVALASNVLQFENPSPSSLLVIDTAKKLTFFADPAGAPTTSQSLDTGVVSFLAFDGKGTVAYVKTIISNADGSVRATDSS